MNYLIILTLQDMVSAVVKDQANKISNIPMTVWYNAPAWFSFGVVNYVAAMVLNAIPQTTGTAGMIERAALGGMRDTIKMVTWDAVKFGVQTTHHIKLENEQPQEHETVIKEINQQLYATARALFGDKKEEKGNLGTVSQLLEDLERELSRGGYRGPQSGCSELQGAIEASCQEHQARSPSRIPGFEEASIKGETNAGEGETS